MHSFTLFEYVIDGCASLFLRLFLYLVSVRFVLLRVGALLCTICFIVLACFMSVGSCLCSPYVFVCVFSYLQPELRVPHTRG
jgi:hypothetical protein